MGKKRPQFQQHLTKQFNFHAATALNNSAAQIETIKNTTIFLGSQEAYSALHAWHTHTIISTRLNCIKHVLCSFFIHTRSQIAPYF